MTELATEGLSLLKLGALLERADAMSPVSESVCRCMAGLAAAAYIALLARVGDYRGQSSPQGNIEVLPVVAVALRGFPALQLMRQQIKKRPAGALERDARICRPVQWEGL